MTIEIAIVVLLCLLLFVLCVTCKSESFTTELTDDAPGYTSGASMRISNVSVSTPKGKFEQEFDDREGNFYARYYSMSASDRSAIKNPTYHTAVTI
jgi:hypothetical protein